MPCYVCVHILAYISCRHTWIHYLYWFPLNLLKLKVHLTPNIFISLNECDSSLVYFGKKKFDLVKSLIFCDLLKFQKSRQTRAVFASLPSSKGHGSSHVLWRSVTNIREFCWNIDLFLPLFARIERRKFCLPGPSLSIVALCSTVYYLYFHAKIIYLRQFLPEIWILTFKQKCYVV